MNFKIQLEYYLHHHSMTASDLARAAGVPRQNISNWLMNQKPKDVEQVKRVANVFRISLDHLLFGNASEESGFDGKSSEVHWMSGVFEVNIRKIK